THRTTETNPGGVEIAVKTGRAAGRQGVLRRTFRRYLMFVDASAMVAILVDESDAAALAKRLEQAAEPCTSPIAIWEAIAAVARVSNVPIRAAERILDRFLEQATVRVVPITI